MRELKRIIDCDTPDVLVNDFEVFWKQRITSDQLRLQRTFNGFDIFERFGNESEIKEHRRVEILFIPAINGNPQVDFIFRIDFPSEWSIRFRKTFPPYPEQKLENIFEDFLQSLESSDPRQIIMIIPVEHELFLPTQKENFTAWLANWIETNTSPTWDTPTGYITLIPITNPLPDGRIIMDLRAITYALKQVTNHTVGVKGAVSPVKMDDNLAIGFKVSPEENQIRVNTGCLQEKALPYFEQILQAIKQKWLETPAYVTTPGVIGGKLNKIGQAERYETNENREIMRMALDQQGWIDSSQVENKALRMVERHKLKQYHLKNIRALLTEGFDAEELRRLCHDESNFRPVYNKLAQYTGKATIIDQLLEYAIQKLLIETLLTWAKEHNPAMYEKYQPYYSIVVSSITVPELKEDNNITIVNLSNPEIGNNPEAAQALLDEPTLEDYAKFGGPRDLERIIRHTLASMPDYTSQIIPAPPTAIYIIQYKGEETGHITVDYETKNIDDGFWPGVYSICLAKEVVTDKDRDLAKKFLYFYNRVLQRYSDHIRQTKFGAVLNAKSPIIDKVGRVTDEGSGLATSDLRLKSKRGPRKYSRAEKVTARKEWDELDRDATPITLEEWLENKFGYSTEGILNVPKSTFYGWPKS